MLPEVAMLMLTLPLGESLCACELGRGISELADTGMTQHKQYFMVSFTFEESVTIHFNCIGFCSNTDYP